MFPTTDRAKAKLWFGCFVISLALNAMLLGPVAWAWALETPNAASWVQAVGSIVAVAVAVYAVSYQMNLASRDRAIQGKQAFVQDLAKAASLIEQAQMYSLKIAKQTLGGGTLDASLCAAIQIEAEALHRQLSTIPPLHFANTPVLDAVTVAQSASHLLLEHAKSYAEAASKPVAGALSPAVLHGVALDLSEKFRSSALAIRQFGRSVEVG